MKNEDKQSASQQIVNAMRAKAKSWKDKKKEAGDGILGGIDRGRLYMRAVVCTYKMSATVAEATARAVERILEDPQLRNMATSIVGNVVQDAGNRLNELANLVEAITKDEEFQAAMSRAGEDIERFKKAQSGLMEQAMKKKGFNPLHVVKEEDMTEEQVAEELARVQAELDLVKAKRSEIVDEMADMASKTPPSFLDRVAKTFKAEKKCDEDVRVAKLLSAKKKHDDFFEKVTAGGKRPTAAEFNELTVLRLEYHLFV